MDADSVTIKQKTYSLHELMLSIQSVLSKTYASRQYWIRCEVSRVSIHAQSGHCYLELVDKNETAILAQLKAMIWSDKYKAICQKFESVTNTPIANGMKLLLSCSVNFHPLHGLSLTIHDIEPSFTLGEMARMKNNSITRLKSEGLFNQNKSRSLPLFPGRIAVISVATSRGYQDFITTIVHYQRKFNIRHTLFEAILQGDNAILSLSNAIKKIISQKEKFDAIAIIRGGAGDSGLSCYDEYSLASIMAGSPLPIITGIGHATNETVAEMIAFKNCITPTAAASFLLEKFDTLYVSLNDSTRQLKESVLGICNENKTSIHSSAERICMFVRNKMEFHKFKLTHFLSGLPVQANRLITGARNNIQHSVQVILNVKRYGSYQLFLSQLEIKIKSIQSNAKQSITLQHDKISQQSAQLISAQRQLQQNNIQLDHIAEKIKLLDPINTLKRGYSITRLDGKALTDPLAASKGSVLETQLAGGVLISTVNK